MTTAVTSSKAKPPAKAAATDKPATELSHGLFTDFGLPSLNRLRQEFEELWNKFYNEVPALWNAERNNLRWAFDVADKPDAFVITAEAPGFDASDFNVELRGGTLVLQAKTSKEEKTKDKEAVSSMSFYRAMSIPEYVAADKIEAAYDKGILTVTLPKTEEGKGRKIAVKAQSTT